MTTTDTAPDLLTHALAYAESGLRVFPCLPGGKTPLTSSGFLDATTDPDRIREWWAWRPHANIATPTGAPGFDVLDVDVRPDGNGWAAYRRATVAGALDGWQRAIRTPSGGLHLHYPGTNQRNGSLRDHHIDFRATGGYVLLPPSLGQTKAYSRRYEVIRAVKAPGQPLDWARVTHLIAPPAPCAPRREPRDVSDEQRTAWLASHVARQPTGNRNNALFWAACRATEAGIADLDALVDAAVTAGLPRRQANLTIASAQRVIAHGPASSPTGIYR
ncbi:bifunctional DNA primase/polymerase [uncultured Cellulomonas sp.]|uniref:bifunctional DNA primase/polymerase n=1 Tax=uncultured Cellulomonas sp. TaxID=189682 RepID=UPI0028E56D05|nr:bifunctional DNA primase/polymerase [uncultured Cellulomonas sp.]